MAHAAPLMAIDEDDEFFYADDVGQR